MMTCRELIDFLMDYLEGNLSPEQRDVFEQHLHCCPPCVDYLRTYEATVRLGQAACRCDDDIPAAVPDDLVTAVLHARKTGEGPASK
jgi:anti-sigma factor RsiW